MDEAISSYVRRNHNLLIGEATAERIKKVGIAKPPTDGVGKTVHIKGRDLVNGVPKEISINQGQIAEALSEPVGTIVEGVRIALENTAPELAADICDQGIVLTGVAHCFRASTRSCATKPALPVTVAEDPLTCVALGTGRARWRKSSSAAFFRPPEKGLTGGPPGGPRRSWSRRAQYGLFFGFLAAMAGLIIGMSCSACRWSRQSYASVRGVALDATAPVTSGLRAVTATVGGLFTGADLVQDAYRAHQNARLKHERELMLQRIVEAKAISLENRELKAALQLREHSRTPVATAGIVGSSFSSPRRYAILSVGGADGVRVGMPVRSSKGLIGRVVDAGSLSSRVLLVSDRASIIPARILRSGQPVISQGRGDGTVDLRPLEVGRNPFKPGDIVITSGTGGLYPPLVPIARVVSWTTTAQLPSPRRPRVRPALPWSNSRTSLPRSPRKPAAGRTLNNGPRGPRFSREHQQGSGGGRELRAGDLRSLREPADRAPDRIDERLVSGLRLHGSHRLAAPSGGRLAGMVGRSARLHQRPRIRASDRLFRRAVDCGDACARPRRSTHDVARLLARMVCAALLLLANEAAEWRIAQVMGASCLS